MFRSKLLAAPVALTIAALTIAAPAFANAPARQPEGLWLNPHGSVAVRTGPCGDKLCGWIVWANAQAQSDAKEGGVTQLIGTELLENYSTDGPGEWSGTVYVPDMGKRFTSFIKEVSPTRLKISGCILGGLICKSQTWTRIEKLPNA